MDFGKVLHKAQKNDNQKKDVRYYSTKFEPPKKEQRTKSLSVNIQKFLERKEAEERVKEKDAKEQREQLLELRSKDKKATRRVNVMLKRTKSANKSALDEATYADNAATTLGSSAQPDEDDYGYVSQSAAEFYNKMMDKYSKTPDEPKFKSDKRKVSTNLTDIKTRVKAALQREEDEAALPHRRKRKHKESGSDEVPPGDPYEPEPKRKEKVKPKFKAPPPMNFSDLLKIAEKKQFEPIVIETKKEKDEERPLTKRQRREMEKDKEYHLQREARKANKETVSENQPSKSSNNNNISSSKDSKDAQQKRPSHHEDKQQKNNENSKLDRNIPIIKKSSNNNDQKAISSKSKFDDRPNNSNNGGMKVSTNSQRSNDSNSNSKYNKPDQSAKGKFPPRDLQSGSSGKSGEVRTKQFPPKDLKPKQFPPKDMKSKQFPPKDVRGESRQFPPNGKRKPQSNPRRIYDDDESEYDSEMDDFIDDGDEETDYSKHISEIFGYDKRKYACMDDDVDNMETSFAQQMKEEVISKKIGIMEDLEDMKLEEAEKKRKKIMQKRRL